ncbi:hypothetical protein ACA910_004600 [Epithemia clementina (nom. ined.)]
MSTTTTTTTTTTAATRSSSAEDAHMATTATRDEQDACPQKVLNEVEAKTMMQPSKAKATSTTFHWEMNLYSAVAMALLYYATAERHRVVWHVLYALLALDAARYYYRRGAMAGVPYTLPLVNLMAMLIHPERFWAELGTIALASPDGLCANTMVGNQLIFVTDPALCRQVFTGEDDFGLYAHPNAIWLFDPKNLIYLQGSVHKKVRAVLTPALFSDAALQQYAQAQERVCRRALEQHAAKNLAGEGAGQPFDAMVAFRQLGAQSSQEAFLGPYLTPEMRVSLESDILVFTMGFLSFPFPYVGGLRQALLAKKRVETLVRDELVPQARAHVLAGKPPRCLLEHWCAAIVQAAQERNCDVTQVHGCTDDDIGRCLLDFLFAAQDATNSALVYGLDVLQAFPNVLQKCHEEIVHQVGLDGSIASLIGGEDKLIYTGKVANQLLHYKPPVPMVPHLSRHDTTLAGHVIAKGTVVIPSVTYSARVSGHALEFWPERDDADAQFLQTVVFGAGQHKCPGRRYAESLLRVFVSVVAQDYVIERPGPRPGPDDFIFFPTLFPKDSKFILRKRPRDDGTTTGAATSTPPTLTSTAATNGH